jgi:hypothetical protein
MESPTDRRQIPDDQREGEIEIVDLDSASARARPARPHIRSPRSPRQRRWQFFVTAGLILLTLLVIIASYAPTRNALGALLLPSIPTPVPTLTPGDDHFYVEGSPTWGKLSIDGAPPVKPPLQSLGKPIQLAPGQHMLLWTPIETFPLRFSTQSCTISVPPDNQNDSCYHGRVLSNTQPAWLIRIIAPFPSLTDLLPEQRQSVINTVHQALDTAASTTTIQPGEPYATSSPNNSVAIAHEPLKAHLHFLLETDPKAGSVCVDEENDKVGICSLNNQDCYQLCDSQQGWQFTAPTLSDSWNILAVVRAVWDYTKMDGTVVARNQPDSSSIVTKTPAGQQVQGYDHLATMNLVWLDNHWQAQAFFPQRDRVLAHQLVETPSPVCATAWEETRKGPPGLPSGVDARALNWEFLTAASANDTASSLRYADGCLVTTSLSRGKTPYQTAVLLHRFGILLTANEAARQQWPDLPVASEATQTTLQDLLTELQRLSGDPSIPSISS